MDILQVRNKINELGCCVIIPTYNNGRTLGAVIEGVQVYTSNIIVVNDGCTDNTVDLLKSYLEIETVEIYPNTGKGLALQRGFEKAIQSGYRYAITIDSDGQHFADDIPAFLEKIEREPDSVIIGARNMEQSSVPGTSSFGHKFSIFWFKVETGIKVQDVQSGYRLYPLNILKGMHLFTKKYEFEVEVLVRLAWKGVKVLSIPVKVYYAPKEERVSHFRKVPDFTRVSIVNSILVFMALLFVRPFLFLRGLKKHSVKGFINEYVVNSNDSNLKLALSVSLGLFIGVSPFWGWQLMLAFGLSHFFRLNKFITVAFSNISLPPVLPFILIFSYQLGEWVFGATTNQVKFTEGSRFEWVKANLLQYVSGSFMLGIGLALVFGVTSYLLLTLFRKPNPQAHSVDSDNSKI